jgi:hypothetical protein
MRYRCGRASHPEYSRYGGRGIAVCEEWLTWEGFHKWAIAAGYLAASDGVGALRLSLDRVDPDGDYEPRNCQWVSCVENSRRVVGYWRNRVQELEALVECLEAENQSLREAMSGG